MFFFQNDKGRKRTPSALPDDQYDVILNYLNGEKLKRIDRKGTAKTALNKSSQWKLTVQEMREAAYEGQTKQRLVYNAATGHPLIVMRMSEFELIVDYFHTKFIGVGAEKLAYKMGQVYVHYV